MHRPILSLTNALMAAGAALAHEGVTNPAVKTRMHTMSTIGQHTKTLGDMAKGAATFDAQIARQAAGAIATHAARITPEFQARETDPKSDALPLIWEQYQAFTDTADQLQQAAQAAARDIQTSADLQSALRAIGATCASCHKAYRK